MWDPVAWETKNTTSIAVLMSGSLKPRKWEEVAISCLQAQNPKPCLSPVVSTSTCSLIRTAGEPVKHKRTEPRTNYCSAPARSMQPHSTGTSWQEKWQQRLQGHLQGLSQSCHLPLWHSLVLSFTFECYCELWRAVDESLWLLEGFGNLSYPHLKKFLCFKYRLLLVMFLRCLWESSLLHNIDKWRFQTVSRQGTYSLCSALHCEQCLLP